MLRIAVIACVGGLLVGCSTQRTLQIDSEPSGARIWVNGELQQGVTPVDVAFVHYGRFDVRLEKDGYESVATELHVATEIDGYPIIDLPLEMLRAQRSYRRVVALRPSPPSPTEADVQAVLARAKALKERTRVEVIEPGTPGRAAPGLLQP